MNYRTAKWDSEHWGNHRILVEIESQEKIAAVEIPWRRPDRNPEKKGIFIRSSKSGQSVSNIFVKEITKECGSIAFEPVSGPGIYEIYFMKYEGTTRAPYPVISYCCQPGPEDQKWIDDAGKNWPRIPIGKVLVFESCDELHSFFPMEVIATQEEMRKLIDNEKGRNFLIFPESRENSIRMRKDLPHHWMERGAFQDYRADVCRGEFFVFQLGVYAHKANLENIGIGFSNLQAESGSMTIAAEDMTCFNLEGISYLGEPFRKHISLSKQEIRPLWIGIKVKEEIEAGLYEGTFPVTSDQGNEMIGISLNVLDQNIDSGGDDEPWRLSRLRWLNSTLGSDEKLIKPYTPVKKEDDILKILGREIEIGSNALPKTIKSYFSPEVTEITHKVYSILSAPVEFDIRDAGGQVLQWDRGKLDFSEEDSCSQCFTLESRNTHLIQNIKAVLEPDGSLEYSFRLEAKKRIEIKDTILRIPLEKHTVKYILGLGFQGGAAPEEWEWKWDTVNKNQDSVWIGSEQGGLQISLKDEKYRRPLNTNFYRLQPLVSPESWDNEGKGRIFFGKNHNGNFILNCSGGERIMKKGKILYFNFRFLITPFRPLDTNKQWNTRFYHQYNSPDEIKKTGANIVNIHHAQPVNPYINYPFLKTEELKDYSDKVHDLGMKLRLYYTVRELTNHAPEIFALKSLGDEIFSNGPGGGHSWLQEHFREDYIAAWHVYEYSCVAVANSGTSRWHNYYVEGLDWLARNMEIDGVYIDDLAFDRNVMKRVRRILDRHRNGAIIDLHSANQFNEKDGFANSINMYMEHMPYVDKIWFGEYFDYSKGPDYWMTEVAGIPFGTMGEMLQDGGDIWRGMLYGMTSRYPHEKGDPGPVWKVWQEFGMQDSRMIGYWADECPVKTSHPDILATVYTKKNRVLISLASWADQAVTDLGLRMDWAKLGFDPDEVVLKAPFMEGYQKERVMACNQPVHIPPAGGALLILSKTGKD